MTAEKLTSEEVVASFVRSGHLKVDDNGAVWRIKRKVGGNQGPRIVDIEPVRADKRMPNGHMQIQVWAQGRRIVCFAHRLIWYLATDELIGVDHIHHKNKNRADNRISNLERLSEMDHIRRHAPERKIWNKDKGGTEKVKQWHRKTAESRRKSSAKRNEKVYRLWENGYSPKELAKQFGIGERGIYHRLQHHRQHCENGS